MKTVYTLADLRAWRQEDTPPIRLGVLGRPVAHSRSPAMQNAGLSSCGISAQYARFEILPNELREALAVMKKLDFIGVNLTVPHKLAGFSLVEEADAFARQVGAINTIRFDEGKMVGANTDGPGFESAIRESFGAELRDLRVLVLGAGGAGQAVAARCALSRCPKLLLANRDFAKAKTLEERWAGSETRAVPWKAASLGEALEECDLIVHATPLGLQPNDLSPLACAPLIHGKDSAGSAQVPRLQSRHLVYDLNYQPTQLLLEARAAGARAASGLTMLLHQGALAFEFWFNRPAPVEIMRAALAF